MKHSLLFASLATTLLSGLPVLAFAQQTIDNTHDIPLLPSITKPAAQPSALVTGTLGGEAGVIYKDNIYRTKNNSTSDFIGYAAPAFGISSGNDRYTARVTGKVEGGAYADNSNNNYLDGDLDGKGRLQLSPSTALTADGRIRHDHVEIGSFVDTPDQQAKDPTQYNNATGKVGIETFQGPGEKIMLSANTGLDYYNYQNVDRVGGGRIINDDRDRTEWNNTVRAGYQLSQGWMPYIEGGYNQRNYDNRIDDTTLYSRDSSGYDALVGLQYGKPAELLTADIAAGYMRQNYDDNLLDDNGDFALRGVFSWQAKPYLNVHGDVDRSIEENTLHGSSSYTRTRVGGGAKYNFMPKWAAAADLHYTNYDFVINPALNPGSRSDDVYDASLLLQYDITEAYTAGLEYLFVERDSSRSDLNFDSNSFILRLAAQY